MSRTQDRVPFITALAVRNRAVTLMLTLLVVLGGIWSVRQLNTEMLPNFDVPLITVLTVYPGASSEAVLTDVTKPIEDAISGVSGLKSIQSTSESAVSTVIAEFDYGTNVRDAKEAISQHLGELNLPGTALAPKVAEFSFDALPILRLSFAGGGDIGSLRDVIEAQVVPRLTAVDGVSRIELVGGGKQQVSVLLDAAKMAEAGLSASQVVATLRANNVAVSSGDIRSGERELPVLTTYRLGGLEDIANLLLLPTSGFGSSAGGLPQLMLPPLDMAAGSTPVGGSGGYPAASPNRTGLDSPVGASQEGQESQTYEVKPGDTLWGIAGQLYGDPTLFPLIVEANAGQISDPGIIHPGMVLQIPPVTQPATPAASEVTPAATPTSPPLSVTPPAVTAPASGLTGMPSLPTPSRPSIRIRDVAEVKMDLAEGGVISRLNGRPSVGVLVYKSANANTVEVTDQIQKRVAEALTLRPDLEVATVSDQSRYVKEALGGMYREGLLGAIFAVIVIFVFIGSLRSTLVTAISIPVSLLIALVLLHWRGDTLNIMTLGGLAVATGRVVDDAIVVLENIFRHTRGGQPIQDAALAATEEVSRAIIASTLTTVAVFLPLGFVGGLVGRIFLPFALTVVFALIASLLVALTLIPTLSAFLVRTRVQEEHHPDTWMQQLYTPAVRWSLSHRLVVLLVAGALFLGTLGLLKLIGSTFLPASQEKVLQVRAELPAGTDPSTTESVAGQVEQVISRRPNVEMYETTIGNTGSLFGLTGFGLGNSATADLYVRLKKGADAEHEASTLREALASLGQQTAITVSTLDASGSSSGDLEVIVSGEDYAAVSKAADSIQRSLQTIPNLANMKSDLTEEKPEINVQVNPEKAAENGLSAAQVALQLRDMLVGQNATRVDFPTGSYDVFVQVRPDDVQSLDKLKALAVGLVKPVNLGDVADVQERNGPARIIRRDRTRAITISGAITTEDTGGVSAAAKNKIEALQLPAGVQVRFGGVTEEQTEGFANLGIALVAAVILVYVVMVATMGSLIEPMIILVSLPLASIGALLALFITGRTLSMSALIGLLMLIGIVVTNAIVLLDLVRQLRARHLRVSDALVEAGRTRIRPILMTAGATILALMPLALGFNSGSIIATELATVVVGGLLSSTLLTLIVVPVVYSLLFERRHPRIGGRN